MANLFIQESYVNASEGYRIGDSEVYETWTDNPGDLFRSLRREYGKAQNMYRDTDDGVKRCGWVFTKRVQYTDSKDTYLQEVWVTLHEKEPKRTTTYYPRYLD